MDRIITIILVALLGLMAYVILTMLSTRGKLQRRRQNDRERIISGGGTISRPRDAAQERTFQSSATVQPVSAAPAQTDTPSQPKPADKTEDEGETPEPPEGSGVRMMTEDDVPAPGSPFHRDFWKEYSKILGYPKEKRIGILKPLLDSGQIDKKTYNALLNEEQRQDGYPESTQKPSPAPATEEPTPPIKQDTQGSGPSEPRALRPDDFDNDDFGIF